MSQMDDYGRHEVLHMASFLASSVYEQLVAHDQITSNSEWLALAQRAAAALSDLYQAIGAVHLSDEIGAPPRAEAATGTLQPPSTLPVAATNSVKESVR